MRKHFRTLLVLALGIGLLALFLRQVDLSTVATEIRNAKPVWLLMSLISMYVNLAIRSMRWQFLLEPVGKASFTNTFRATTVGFAARGVLPSAAGELVRPYFFSRHERISAAGAFATVLIERLIDMLTVLSLLAIFVFTNDLSSADPTAYAAIKWAGALGAVAAVLALAMLFGLASRPQLLLTIVRRIERMAPARLAGMLEGLAQKFVAGLTTIRSPGRVLVALAWSVPLWMCIAFGVWAVAVAFNLNVPFSGSFLLIAFLTVGITVPTPGAVGGFHEAFRIGATQFFGAPEGAAVGAAIVLHAISVGSSLALGIVFAAQAGMNVTGIRRLVTERESSEAV